MANPFEKLRQSLSKTKDSLVGRISRIIGNRKIDDDLLDEIEEILIEADVGVEATQLLLDTLQETTRSEGLAGDDIMIALKNEMSRMLGQNKAPSTFDQSPVIWLIVGVNGVGKTTTIGKLATLFSSMGKKVMIAACDTFRAAAIDQVAIWAERSGVEIIKAQDGADPASVAYDAVQATQARAIDILLIDTAGRLHTKTNLMEELKKIRRVIQKANPDIPIISELIVDGSTGQNTLNQVKVFRDAVGCDGLIITKLDGTAKGGILLAISRELNVPIDYIGVGESVNDLQPFDAEKFVEALFT